MKLQTKLTSAINASLAVTLAYLLSIYFGMGDYASTAAITIMILATADDFRSSLTKGVLRVLGTLLGAVLGLGLIALFPQERMTYLFLLSVFVTFFLYLARAYRGDKTVFMLSALTMMLVFNGGDVNSAFLYGVNRTVMTVFGIVIYTSITIFLFPKTIKKPSAKNEKAPFVWFDIEDIKGTFITFLVFWSGVYIWIVYNPPQGFYIVTLATSFSLYTTYTLVRPMLLIILFSLSFVFYIFSYVFILPNLYSSVEFALFLFIYSFIGFYFIKPKISIFFLSGLSIFLIKNEMNYNFQIFMIILLIFYMFLFLLLLYDYFPFNTKANSMFLALQKRYFLFARSILKPNYFTFYAKKFLHSTLVKMQIYMGAIDFKHFNHVTKEELSEFLRECEKFTKELQEYIKSDTKVPSSKLLLQYEELSSIKFESLKENKF